MCQYRQTPSKVGEEFVSSEEEARTELSYASAKGSKYVAPLVENPIPIPDPAPCQPFCSTTTCPTLEEIMEEPRDAICNDLDALLRESEVERVRDLQEELSNSVVHPPPQVMEKVEWDPSDVSRARQKGAEGHLFLSLYQKGFLKTPFRALGYRRARRTLSLST